MKALLVKKIMKHRTALQIWSLFHDSVDPVNVVFVQKALHKKNVYWLRAWARYDKFPYIKDHRLTKAECLDDKRWDKIAKFIFF